MCKELIQVTTQDISNAIPVTSSRVVAEQFKKKHYQVLRDIKKLYEELIKSLNKKDLGAYKKIASSYIDKQNKSQPEILINEDLFMMLVMGYNTQKALIIKNEFIKAFKFMKHELTARKETRHLGVYARIDFTDTIKKNVVGESRFKNFAFSTYTKLVYKKVFGKTLVELKEERGLSKKDNLRNFLTIEELGDVQKTESKVATIIEFSKGKNDKDVYAEIVEYLIGYKND